MSSFFFFFSFLYFPKRETKDFLFFLPSLSEVLLRDPMAFHPDCNSISFIHMFSPFMYNSSLPSSRSFLHNNVCSRQQTTSSLCSSISIFPFILLPLPLQPPISVPPPLLSYPFLPPPFLPTPLPPIPHPLSRANLTTPLQGRGAMNLAAQTTP